MWCIADICIYSEWIIVEIRDRIFPGLMPGIDPTSPRLAQAAQVSGSNK